jgi:hypothetical protein
MIYTISTYLLLFHSHSQPFASNTILVTCTIKLQFPLSTINFPNLNLKLYLLHPYCLVEYFIPLPRVCNPKT